MTLVSQEFDVDQQYKQAMQNAKAAFEAKQYSQAVLFYREAQKIKPESLLPKYKIEDIRTIYIEREMHSINADAPISNKVIQKRKKEVIEETKLIEEKAKESATLKMNEEADKAYVELEALKVSVIVVDEHESFQFEDSILVEDIVSDRELAIEMVQPKDNQVIDGGVVHDKQANLTLQKRKESETNTMQAETGIETPKKATEPKQLISEKPKSAGISPKKLTAEEQKIWIQNEEQKLKEAYPNKKTIEEIDKPGKHITRIIMHIDNKITTYLKVKHSWGATYFFMDEVGQELRSINEQYFNLMTNLRTYGY